MFTDIISQIPFTIKTATIQEVEQLLKVLKTMNITKVSIKDTSEIQHPVITKGNKALNPKALFGIWQKNPRTLNQIRSSAWKRKEND